ncbi:CDP-diacylglycerol--glycerol-3-phosphate 3-phosphatidyltransferase [candidate division KSB1 bacterium]|nr:CDP-diacylglycerol--glycerol-3-phosphate 3-phosphatidyltransferase [candidate division KSB1 bacterium]
MIKPNTLTLIRIAATPPFLLFYWLDTTWSLFVCLLLYIVFEITDFLDGNIARRSNMVSDFGKLMDPFADSISRFTVFLCFLSSHLAPVWIIAIFFYRDVFVSVVRVFSMKEGVVVAARKSGKTKAWVQAIAIFGVLFILIFQKMDILPKPFIVLFNIPLATELIFLASIVTLWSAIDYWIGNKSIVINSMNFENK